MNGMERRMERKDSTFKIKSLRYHASVFKEGMRWTKQANLEEALCQFYSSSMFTEQL